MVQLAFTEFVKNLCFIFERKVPSDQVMDLWFQELQDIRDDMLQQVYGRMKREETWPRNFPSKVMAIYRAIVPVNQFKQPVGCSDCDHGMIHVNKDGYAYAFRCGSCQEDNREGIPTAKRSELLLQGYALNWTMAGAARIKTLPMYEIGKEFMPGGLMEAISKIGEMGEWQDQF